VRSAALWAANEFENRLLQFLLSVTSEVREALD
jgi:hypothetical protein